MGCLNSTGDFEHWFANIHLSGPCNRKCYFCIGQHMMALDSYNTLDTFPLKNIDEFLLECYKRKINEINMTGTNTDPMLYKHTGKLRGYIREQIPDLIFGIRTNAVKKDYDLFRFYDKGSITICSLNEEIYKEMMGLGKPPDLDFLLRATRHWIDRKINIVLGPENVEEDIFNTIDILSNKGIDKINLREPYGQPHVGNPISRPKEQDVLGNPGYWFKDTLVTYWDVHYTEVESVNLYANGNVSTDYPITRGHHKNGEVKDQSNFEHGRQVEQWVNL